jgi:hypothetical protein
MVGGATPAKQLTEEAARSGRAPLQLFFQLAHAFLDFLEAGVCGLKRLFLDQRRLHKHVRYIGNGTYRLTDESLGLFVLLGPTEAT